jgi:hypothetical protein|tara:strand:+ start:140 stop:547 length:408 start_codon:yes stop_codon:yes gene_type:complete
MNALIGLALILVSGGMAGYWQLVDKDVADIQYFVQMGIAGVGGIYILLTSASFKSLFSIKKDKVKMTKITSIEQLLNSDNKDLIDFMCLSYLRTRADELASKEALSNVIDLNNFLFKAKSIAVEPKNEKEVNVDG